VSFERWASSDIYIFEHVSGYIECSGCTLVLPDDLEIFGTAVMSTPREALTHLDLHEEKGDDIGGARRRIEIEYEDLDAPIVAYQRQTFRDASNGE